MIAAYYHSPELPWSPALTEERRFRIISITTLILVVLFSLVISQVKLPQLDRSEAESLPPRLAKLVIQEKPQPPPPPPPPEPVKPAEKASEVLKPEIKKEIPPAQQVQAARAKAANTGLLAMRNELTSLQNNSLSALTGNKTLTQSVEQDITRRSIITSGATSGSGGISTSQLSRDAGQTRLAGRNTTTVESALLKEEIQAGGKEGSRQSGRSTEQIKLTLDQNKGALFALYQRALRSDPSLQGKVVLEITIAPSGNVTQCKVVSSELKDDELVRKVVARVKLFQFGAKTVDPTVFLWPIDFLPFM